jgi:two-component system NtrC family sensor kinase
MSIKEKTYKLFIGFFCLISSYAVAQNQQVADSLAKVYQEKPLEDSVKLEVLRNMAFNEVRDLNLALHYAEELIKLAKQKGDNLYLYRGYLQKGNKKKQLGDLEEALASYFKSVETASKFNYLKGEGTSYGAIAAVYSVSGNHRNAVYYYKKAIAIHRQSDDAISLASAILNAGEEFRKNKKYDSALLYFNESGIIFEKKKYLTGKAYNLGNIGLVYASIGKNNLAEKNIDEAISILEKSKDFYPICVYLLSMSDLYLQKKDWASALKYAEQSLQLATHYKLKEQIRDSNLKQSQLYEQIGNTSASLNHFKNYTLYRDSLNNIQAVQKMADLRTDYEVSQKQIEVDLLNQQKKNQQIIQISTVIISSLVIIGLSFSFWQKRQSNIKLSAQQVIIAERNNQLQDLNASKDKLFSIIGHDLKGPLNALNMFSKLLSTHTDQFSKDEIKKLAIDLNMSVKNLYKLLENLLEWGRSQIGAIDFTPERFDMATVLRKNQELLKGQAEDKKITIVNETALTLPVSAHHNTIDTVVRNLLSNAIKFTPEGGMVELRAEQIDGYARVSIADNGVGIKQTAIGGLFKVGTHHASLGTAQEKGTGLGLMLCKDFVERNGGTIGVESTEGKGSTFYFTVPVASE